MRQIRTATPPSPKRLQILPAIFPVVLALLVSCTQGSSETSSASKSSGPITAGDVAPAFRLPSTEGDEVSLADFAGKRPVLLYFSMGPG